MDDLCDEKQPGLGSRLLETAIGAAVSTLIALVFERWFSGKDDEDDGEEEGEIPPSKPRKRVISKRKRKERKKP